MVQCLDSIHSKNFGNRIKNEEMTTILKIEVEFALDFAVIFQFRIHFKSAKKPKNDLKMKNLKSYTDSQCIKR